MKSNFRTKNAVRDLDNLNYRKMKKILMTEMMETESTIGQVGPYFYLLFLSAK